MYIERVEKRVLRRTFGPKRSERIKQKEMGGPNRSNTHGEMRNVTKFQMENSKGREQWGAIICRWEDNIKL